MEPYFDYYGIDRKRVQKATKMLQAEQIALYTRVNADTLFGVVRSQTNPNLIYGCYLRNDGSFGCKTQKLNTCGGLRGSLCKHILVLIGYNSNRYNVRQTFQHWIRNSQRTQPDKNNRPLIRYIFDEYIDATGITVNSLNDTIQGQLFPDIELGHGLMLISQERIYDGKVRVKILDEVKPKQEPVPIYEAHISINIQGQQTKDLSLNYVLCLGDRKRITSQQALDLAWQECNTCQQWFCADCIEAFQDVGDACPSVIFGHTTHKMNFIIS